MQAAVSPLATPDAWDLVSTEYAAVTAPFLSRFSEAALERSRLGTGARIVDVACGPGTLSLLAAARGHTVDAVDFAPNMIAELEARANQAGLVVSASVGDGQSLPFESNAYDGAFSMFGLMFFPSRANGFGELHRVLRPGGVAFVSSWQPMERFALLSDLFALLKQLLPGLPFGNNKAPLGEPAELEQEFADAGFKETGTDLVSAQAELPTLDETWEMLHRGSAPFALLRRNLGEATWLDIEAKVKDGLAQKYGTGPQTVTMTANLGWGRKP